MQKQGDCAVLLELLLVQLLMVLGLVSHRALERSLPQGWEAQLHFLCLMLVWLHDIWLHGNADEC